MLTAQGRKQSYRAHFAVPKNTKAAAIRTSVSESLKNDALTMLEEDTRNIEGCDMQKYEYIK